MATIVLPRETTEADAMCHPPPVPVAELPARVQESSWASPAAKWTPPPSAAAFPETVVSARPSVPSLKMPPPDWRAEFAEIVLPRTDI